MELAEDGVLGCSGARFRGHEFHFASVLTEARGAALFRTFNAEMEPLGNAGLRVGSVMGSFVHLMDRCGDRRDVRDSPVARPDR